MRLLIVVAAVTLAGSPESVLASDSKIADDLRKFPISRIDSTLGTGTFATWLRRVMGPNTEIDWEVNDCGEGGDGDSAPTCVTAEGKLPPRGRVIVTMVLASDGQDNVAVPALWHAEIQGIGPSEDVKRLADLPATLRRLRALDEQLARLPDRPLEDSTAVNLVRHLSARRLNDALPDVPFSDWVAALAGPDARVTWKLDGCERSRASIQLDGSQDYWACVHGSFQDARAHVGFDIRVGTFAKGPFGVLQIQRVSVHDRRPGKFTVRTVSLEDLPAVLEAIRR